MPEHERLLLSIDESDPERGSARKAAHSNDRDEWQELARQTAASGQRYVRRLRRIAEICERLTGQRIDVEALIEDLRA